MRIGAQQFQQIVGTYLKAEKKTDSTQAAPNAPRDEVDLSDRAGEVARAKQAYDQLPQTRESRVAELRERIQSGAYRLDDDQVAEAILRGVHRETSSDGDEE